MQAPVIYLVRFWIKPGAEGPVFQWLDEGHLRDVVAQPGFLFTRRYKLAEPDDDGWPAYAMLYGVSSTKALEAYFNSDATRRYAREREELGLDSLLKVDRAWGELEYAVDAPA